LLRFAPPARASAQKHATHHNPESGSKRVFYEQ
jgi:hypothetical protein